MVPPGNPVIVADSADNEDPGRPHAVSGTFYGQSMTAGDIYTVAGNGRPGFSGDGGPATTRRAATARRAWRRTRAGNLVIADTEQQPDPGGGGAARARSTGRR